MEAFEHNLTKFAEQLASLAGCTIEQGRSLILQGMLYHNIDMDEVVNKIIGLTRS